MREILAVALAKRMGQVLTTDIAIDIVRESVLEPDLSIDPKRFPVEAHRGYTLQSESLRDAMDELSAHRLAFLAEVEPGLSVSVDWGRLLDLSRKGALAIFTARSPEGELLASLWLFPGICLNTGRRTVSDDLFYTMPTQRGGMLAARLWRYAERSMFCMGVRQATFHSRLDNRAERLARFMGYRPIATRVRKAHDGDDFAEVPTRHRKASDDFDV